VAVDCVDTEHELLSDGGIAEAAMQCRTNIEVAHGTDPRIVEMLLTAAERACVILDTLRHGVDITTTVDLA
jgi:uncharacterized OsmC-like protein